MIPKRQSWWIRAGLIMAMQLLLFFFAYSQQARFEFYTTADGLAGNNTSTVTQDDQGFLWFLNDGKVHRYDGRNFLVCPGPGPDPLLGLASYEDSLLIAWSEHGPFLFNPRTSVWEKAPMQEGSQAPEGVLFWQRMGQDQILLSRLKKDFTEARIWRIQDREMSPVRLPGYMTIRPKSHYWYDIDAGGNSYLACQDTLYQLDDNGFAKTVIPMTDIGQGLQNLCFQFGPRGDLVLLANWRFYVLDRAANRFVPHPANRFIRPGQNHLHRFIIEENGSIWACGQDRNLIYYDAIRDTLFNYHEALKEWLPSANDFKGLYRDKTGIVWVDTRLGLLKVKPQIYAFDHFFQGLNASNSHYSFRGFTEDARGMIYGVYYDGIARFDPARNQPPRLYTYPQVLSFFDLFTEGDTIWVNGGQYLDPESGRLINVPSPFFEAPVGDNGFFEKDGRGVLWWVSQYTLYYLRKTGSGVQWIKELELPEKIYNKTEAFHAGRKSGQLWISYRGKLLQYDPETRKQVWHDPTQWGLSVSRIMAIQEDLKGELWLGTDVGLAHVAPAGGAASLYAVKDGLPNNFVCGLLTEGDSSLWLSTNHGLSRFHIPSKTFINFLEEDGLTFNEFNRKSFYKARDGRLFFGGMRGVNAFFPEEVMQAYRSRNMGAKMVLSALEYTDERRDTIIRKTWFSRDPTIHLYYWDWSYTFEYALTDFNNPQEIFYSYQIEGYKDSWSAPSKLNFARLNSLPAGSYVFRVKARDSRGNWHPNELALKVIVHPPWWATWWAYALYGIALTALVNFLMRYELNRQRLRYSLDLEKLEAERLKELDHFKSRLYTNLTHEFRTPLTVILGMARQLRDSQAARLIENNGQNLLRLINQLLDLSKLENNSFQLHLRQGDIVPYLRYVTESFQTFANGKNLSLRFFSPQESLVMDFDPEQIKQVLINLISNALKFTPSGGEVKVTVGSGQSAVGSSPKPLPTANCLLITVKDTGIGIPEADLPHVFDRFYQVDSSTTRTGEGTGIGLAHALELVKLMEGDLSVKSEPGKGATFTVRLPLRRVAPLLEETVDKKEAPDWVPGMAAPETSQEEGPASLPLLLLIEDNPDVVTYLKTILSGLFRLDVAYNGKIGIEKALEQVPDLIISDVMMPEKDGFEVCDTLKNDERTSHIPLILLTAKADAASRIAGLRRGADAYLSKPFDKEELLVRLESLLERQKRMAAWFSQKTQGAAPDAQLEEAIQVEDAFIQKVRAIIEANYADENFALPALCDAIGMSRSQLFRKMTALVNTTPSDFIRSYRMQKAKDLLQTTDLTVSEVAWQVGYKDPSHFSKSYQEAFGAPPSGR